MLTGAVSGPVCAACVTEADPTAAETWTGPALEKTDVDPAALEVDIDPAALEVDADSAAMEAGADSALIEAGTDSDPAVPEADPEPALLLWQILKQIPDWKHRQRPGRKIGHQKMGRRFLQSLIPQTGVDILQTLPGVTGSI